VFALKQAVYPGMPCAPPLIVQSNRPQFRANWLESLSPKRSCPKTNIYELFQTPADIRSERAAIYVDDNKTVDVILGLTSQYPVPDRVIVAISLSHLAQLRRADCQSLPLLHSDASVPKTVGRHEVHQF